MTEETTVGNGEMESIPAESDETDTASTEFWVRYHAIPLPTPPPPPAPVETPEETHRGARLPYVPALDGIRALAVAAVLLYHQNVGWLPGGFLGVEVFFVLSGYLITSLLLAEARSTGHVDLKAFWTRRARRLLPALYLLLAVCLTYALIFLPSEVARLRGDAIAALFYVTNWWLIFNHRSYFEIVGRPSLFEHLWSLAVEEQFYVIWPPLFALAIARWTERRLALTVVAMAGLATILMAVLFQPGIDPSRVYYGTDTRAAELLIGAALAFVWEPGLPRKWGGQLAGRVHDWVASSRIAAIALEAVGFSALTAVFLAYARTSEYSPFLYRGGFLLVALATAGLIASVVFERTRYVSKALGVAPLRWIGLRSYGIYLWHWPVYMVTRPNQDIQLNGVPLFLLRLAITLILVEISYRLVETPFRRGALGRVWRRLRDSTGNERRVARVGLAGVAGVTASFAIVLSVLVAQAKPAGPPAYLSVQSVHIAAPRRTPTADASPLSLIPPIDPPRVPTTPTPLPTPEGTPTAVRIVTIVTPTPTPTPMPAPTARPTVAPTTAATPTVAPTPTPTPAPTPPPSPTPSPTPAPDIVLQTPVTAVGDSVMVGASQDLANDLPNLDLDAEVGLQVSQAIQILQSRSDAGELNPVVLLDIGNNGPMSSDQFDQVMQVLQGVKHVYFLNLREPRDWQDSNNKVLAEGVQRYPNTSLIDWHAATENRSDLFWDDGIHLRPEGAAFYTNLVMQQLATDNPTDAVH